MRASDDDRERVIAALQGHTAAGRLTLDEFSDRVGEVYAARTLGQLAALTSDLPTVEPPGATPPTPTIAHRRDLLILFAAAAATLILLALLMTLHP